MPDKFPIELIRPIAQYATKDTLASLLVASHSFHSISIRALYTSIPDMDILHTTQCLRTLSMNPELAHLVHSFSLRTSPSPDAAKDFYRALSHALSNMSNLNALSLCMDVSIPVDLLSQACFQLTKLDLSLPSEGSYPVSQFLSTQPTIEELTIICQPEDISTLGPEVLPVLKDLSASLVLLPKLLPYRLARLSRLTVLHTMTSLNVWMQLNMILTLSKLTGVPKSLELAIRVEKSSNAMSNGAISTGLIALGTMTQFLSSLKLDIYGDLIGPCELALMVGYSLTTFPNLKTLTVISPPPMPGACICDPQTQPVPTRPVLTPLDDFSLLFDSTVAVYEKLANLSSLRSALSCDYNEMRNQSPPILDALHDKSYHPDIIQEWMSIHSGLECVVFPTGEYKLTGMDK